MLLGTCTALLHTPLFLGIKIAMTYTLIAREVEQSDSCVVHPLVCALCCNGRCLWQLAAVCPSLS